MSPGVVVSIAAPLVSDQPAEQVCPAGRTVVIVEPDGPELGRDELLHRLLEICVRAKAGRVREKLLPDVSLKTPALAAGTERSGNAPGRPAYADDPDHPGVGKGIANTPPHVRVGALGVPQAVAEQPHQQRLADVVADRGG